MSDAVFILGAVTGVSLVALLLLTLANPSLRIWPTPGTGSWQSYVFWPFFRGLNVLCFVSALVSTADGLDLPPAVRIATLVLLAVSIATFFYAFRVLGRDNSYCARDGLVTSGIYRWSRNPQNAMLIAVYACLAITADDASTYLLCGAMMAAYALMVLAEEPWLEAAYGEAYRRYCRRVPRFFDWSRVARLCAIAGKRAQRKLHAHVAASVGSRLQSGLLPLFVLADEELLLAATACL